jgi:hypothetical protein
MRPQHLVPAPTALKTASLFWPYPALPCDSLSKSSFEIIAFGQNTRTDCSILVIDWQRLHSLKGSLLASHFGRAASSQSQGDDFCDAVMGRSPDERPLCSGPAMLAAKLGPPNVLVSEP